MFTGIVETLATVREVVEAPPGKRLRIAAGNSAQGIKLGDSVCISGCCLTVVGIEGDLLDFEAGPETLSRTTLGKLQAGSRVNLERSLKFGDELGGHIVTGHVDAVGRLNRRVDHGDWSTMWFDYLAAPASHFAPKGSVAVDGVSLTVVDVQPGRFKVQLIPHTLQVTTLGSLTRGDDVNLETDLLAKYVQQHLLHHPLDRTQ